MAAEKKLDDEITGWIDEILEQDKIARIAFYDEDDEFTFNEVPLSELSKSGLHCYSGEIFYVRGLEKSIKPVIQFVPLPDSEARYKEYLKSIAS